MLRPTFLGFETARRAITSSQLGLDTVGHNMANVSTGGYTRQRIDQVSISSSGYRTKFQAYNTQFPGQGSAVIGISQIRDRFLDNRYRAEAANNGEYSIKENILGDLITIFDEVSSDGLLYQFDEFIEALNILKAEATSSSISTVMRNTVQQICNVLNKTATELENVVKQQYDNIKNDINAVNSIMQQIADLSAAIKEDHCYGNPSLELVDARNVLLDQLAMYFDITVSYDTIQVGDRSVEVLKVYLTNGPVDANGDPIPIIDSSTAHKFGMEPASVQDLLADPTAQITIKMLDGITDLEMSIKGLGDGDISDILLTGGFKGYLDAYNGQGVFNGADYRGLSYYRQALDEFANVLADVMNEMNKPRYDLQVNSLLSDLDYYINLYNDPATDPALLSTYQDYIDLLLDKLDETIGLDLPLPAPPYNTGVPITSAGGALTLYDGLGTFYEITQTYDPVTGEVVLENAALGESVTYSLLDVGTDLIGTLGGASPLTARNISVTQDWLDDDTVFNTLLTWEINLVDGEAQLSNKGDNLARMIDQICKSSQSFTGFDGTFQEYLISLQGNLGYDYSQNKTLLSASNSVMGGLEDQRDQISAVDMNEEASNMMIYQNYYNAAARYMTVLDEALGTIIQGMGVVGR